MLRIFKFVANVRREWSRFSWSTCHYDGPETIDTMISRFAEPNREGKKLPLKHNNTPYAAEHFVTVVL